MRAVLAIMVLFIGLSACVSKTAEQGGSTKAKPNTSAEAPTSAAYKTRPKLRPGKAETVKNQAALEPPAAARTPDDADDLLPSAAPEDKAVKPAEPKAEEKEPEAKTPPPVPPALRAQAQKCTKSKGKFTRRGENGTFTCVKPTRDANKGCNSNADCDGLCFARSKTCSPVKPLFGCYDTLEAGGVVNICSE